MSVRVVRLIGLIVCMGMIGTSIGTIWAQESPEPISYGNTVQRSFEPGDGPMLFTFDAQAGDVITLTMVADPDSAVDPALALLGPDGTLVARNDDSLDAAFGMTNARLVNFPIPAAGTYTIQAMRSSEDDGSFTLVLRSANRPRTSNATIAFGNTARGTINTDSVRASYQFRALAGDVVTIVAQNASGNLAPYLALLDQSGKKLTNTITSGSARTARITRFPILTTGSYTVTVSRIGEEKGTTTGAFTLTLTRDAQTTVMKYGDELDGKIDDEQVEVSYLFTATAGDVVTIIMTFEDALSGTLSLIGPDGKTLATKGGGQNPPVGSLNISQYRIPITGGYIVVVGRKGKDRGTSSGAYSLLLDKR
ncbi:MAG: PPC domain-containing protein [Anaerolineae bacterium]|nr:PPC domain-containing protein [Anaerolineae bacterium]